MKRLSLIFMIVAIGLFASLAVADPGPITAEVVLDIEQLSFAPMRLEVEVAPTPTLLCFEPPAYRYTTEDITADMTNYEGHVDIQVTTIPIGGDGFRVLECRSLGYS